MLKLVVSKPMPFAGIDVSKYQDLIEEASSNHTVAIMPAYLHGVLETTMGYDLCVCLNAEECMEEGLFKEGCYRASVVGYPEECRAYLWNDHFHPKGLIVDRTDKKSIDYARKCFNKESYL